MFIQVKDWKNEGQDVAPNCMPCVLQSVNPQSSLHLSPQSCCGADISKSRPEVHSTGSD